MEAPLRGHSGTLAQPSVTAPDGLAVGERIELIAARPLAATGT